MSIYFGLPRVYDVSFDFPGNDDFEPSEPIQVLAIDIPEPLRVAGFDLDNTNVDGIRWDAHILERVLEVWARSLFPLTAKGNLKRADRQFVDHCLKELRDNVGEDVKNLLLWDERYHQILQRRLNETIDRLSTVVADTEDDPVFEFHGVLVQEPGKPPRFTDYYRNGVKVDDAEMAEINDALTDNPLADHAPTPD
jgi:hypothetical protein